MSLDDPEAFPDEARGQQAAVVLDIDRDGAEDLLVVRSDGQVIVFYRDSSFSAPSLRLRLQRTASLAGPINARAWRNGRLLGTWRVDGSGNEALISVTQPGLLQLKWQYPGALEATRELRLERPTTLLLGPSDTVEQQ